ncbi:MAG: carbohydrate porin [Gallionellaceae bacterium]|nr:carbohydrate porin [Gallionellaceae bacterium]
MRVVNPLILAMALTYGLPAGAAEVPANLAQVLQQMQARLAKLEARNAELEAALGSERLSQNEPELATRLKAMEADIGRLGSAGRLAEVVDGISASGGLTVVAQHADKTATGGKSQLSWRSDVEVGLPGGEVGNAEGQFFFHFRVGQGGGLDIPGGAPVNATAFDTGHPDSSNAHAILAQAWYQLDVPLPLDGFKDDSKEHLELTFGKIDPYGFFDGNDASDDETARYLNLNFVHNPLLDAGGGAVFDSYGFTPGLRLAYVNEAEAPVTWGLSYGLFATGGGASFIDSFGKPFQIVQFDTTQKFFGGLEGHYRLYGWHTGRGSVYDGTEESRSGWGVSVDQRVSDGMTLWGRYGHSISGSPMYDRAITLGAGFSGSYWGRAADSLGVAVAHLSASGAYKASLVSPADAEQTVEIYYNWQAMPGLVLTPNYQYISRPAADKANANASVVGVRASLTF